jgi:hypothetical protein
MLFTRRSLLILLPALLLAGCFSKINRSVTSTSNQSASGKTYLSQPLVRHIYTADAAAHVFDDRIYIYPSHDTDTHKTGANGDHYDMMDYRVLSMKTIDGPVTDHGVALSIGQVTWAKRQLWAPDAAFANGSYYLFFPAKDKDDIFRIGVATSKTPAGPFIAEPKPIAGTYSIDPTVFQDVDGSFYLFFGGVRGGQLQHWNNNQYDPNAPSSKGDEFAALPRVAKLDASMKKLAGPVKEVLLLDSNGNRFIEKDNDKRFFEGVWMHRYKGKYYLSYSTGDTHKLCYAMGDSPYGPFIYTGVLLQPVEGWTTHHSIIQKGKKWYLFYHDVQLSGKNHLRNIKVTELHYNRDGTLQTIIPFQKATTL